VNTSAFSSSQVNLKMTVFSPTIRNCNSNSSNITSYRIRLGTGLNTKETN